MTALRIFAHFTKLGVRARYRIYRNYNDRAYQARVSIDCRSHVIWTIARSGSRQLIQPDHLWFLMRRLTGVGGIGLGTVAMF